MAQRDRLVRLDQEEIMVFQEMQDSLDHKVHLDLRGLEEIKVHKVNKEHKDQKVNQVHKDLEELMAMLDLLEHEEMVALKELQDPLDLLDLLDLVEIQVWQDKLVLLDSLAYKEAEVILVVQEIQALVEILAHQGRQVHLGKLDSKGREDQQVWLVSLAHKEPQVQLVR